MSEPIQFFRRHFPVIAHGNPPDLRQAALLGVDALIVNDESHLTPAFAQLLVAVRKLSPSARLNGKRFHTLLVSATERGVGEKPFDVRLDLDVQESERFRRVYEAEKILRLHEATDKRAADAKLVDLALQEPAARTVIFVERSEERRVGKEC